MEASIKFKKPTIGSTKKSMSNRQNYLIVRYCVEMEMKKNNRPYDESLIESLRNQLKEEGILEKAIEFTERSIEASRAFKNGVGIEEVIKIQTGSEK